MSPWRSLESAASGGPHTAQGADSGHWLQLKAQHQVFYEDFTLLLDKRIGIICNFRVCVYLLFIFAREKLRAILNLSYKFPSSKLGALQSVLSKQIYLKSNYKWVFNTTYLLLL